MLTCFYNDGLFQKEVKILSYYFYILSLLLVKTLYLLKI